MHLTHTVARAAHTLRTTGELFVDTRRDALPAGIVELLAVAAPAGSIYVDGSSFASPRQTELAQMLSTVRGAATDSWSRALRTVAEGYLIELWLGSARADPIQIVVVNGVAYRANPSTLCGTDTSLFLFSLFPLSPSLTFCFSLSLSLFLSLHNHRPGARDRSHPRELRRDPRRSEGLS